VIGRSPWGWRGALSPISGRLPIDTVVEERPAPTPTPRPVRRWRTTAIVVALLAAIVIHFSRAHEEVAYLQRVSVQVLAATFVLQFASQLSLNASLLLPLQARVSPVGFWELYVVRTGGFFVGSVVPVAGGLAVRLAYFRKRGLTYADFTWATLFSNVLALGAAAVLAAAAIAILRIVAGPLPLPVLGVTAGVVAISVAAVAVFELLPRLARHRRFQGLQWLSGLSSFEASPRMATQVFALCLIRHMLNFVTFGLLYRALSPVPGAFLAGGLVYALTSPVRMVNITPGNLGVTEWFVALTGKMLAFDLTIGLIAALLFRAIALVAQVIGALSGSAWLGRGRRR
jgi:MFS family permease